MFRAKKVDTIVKIFMATVVDLRDHAEDMKAKIKDEQDTIDKAKTKQQEFAVEGLRAESIATKLEGIVSL